MGYAIWVLFKAMVWLCWAILMLGFIFFTAMLTFLVWITPYAIAGAVLLVKGIIALSVLTYQGIRAGVRKYSAHRALRNQSLTVRLETARLGQEEGASWLKP